MLSRIRRRGAGFTLMELLVVMAIMIGLASLVLPVILYARKNARYAAARQAMDAVKIAMESYNAAFKAYPPDDVPSTSGSEILYYHLCQTFKSGDMRHDAIIEDKEGRSKDTDGNGFKELSSPLGTKYEYMLLEDLDGKKRSYLIVDPGPDGKLGGSIDMRKGWVSGGGKEEADNIFSTQPIKDK